MDAFKLLLPKEKKVDCLEDLGALTYKELKHILVQYREKTSGVKADLILRAHAVFSHAKNFNSQSNDISDESSLLCHENDFTFEAIYDQCKHLPWTADLCGTPHFTFLQLYGYLVIRTSKFKHILLKSTAYKKLKAIQFFFEGFITKIDVAKKKEFTFLNVRVKASMKKQLDMFFKCFSTLATNHGKKFEGHAIELYTIYMKEHGLNVIVSETGLQLSSSSSFLAAFLDGMVSFNNERWGLEIKCPFSKFKISLQDALKDKKFFLENNGGTIKRKHQYYYQVQGQMFCAVFKRIDFVVWFAGSESLFVESIQYDEEFVLSYMPP
eukprot:gene9926-18533_t